jgi:hypothetical protein
MRRESVPTGASAHSVAGSVVPPFEEHPGEPRRLASFSASVETSTSAVPRRAWSDTPSKRTFGSPGGSR